MQPTMRISASLLDFSIRGKIARHPFWNSKLLPADGVRGITNPRDIAVEKLQQAGKRQGAFIGGSARARGTIIKTEETG